MYDHDADHVHRQVRAAGGLVVHTSGVAVPGRSPVP